MKGDVLALGQDRPPPGRETAPDARRARPPHRLAPPTRCSASRNERRPLVLRARGRRHHPGRIRPLPPFPRRAGGPGARAQDRRLSAPHPGRPRRLAALPRRRLRHERQREGLFRAEDDRRRSGRAAHAARARGDPRARRRRRARNVFTRALLALFGEMPLARRADHAGGDHAAAALVPVPPRQGLLLGAHRDRAAPRAAGAEAAGGEPARRRTSTSSSRRRRRRCGSWPKGAASEGAVDADLRRDRRAC